MIWLAVTLQAMFFGLAFVLRTAVQMRRTGGAGFRAFSRSHSGTERVAELLIAAGAAASFAGSALAGVLPEIALPAGNWVVLAGVMLAAASLALIVWAQFVMGNSWRIGVDQSELTELVTGGPFGVVRNPIFSGMLLFWCSVVLVAPNLLTLVAPVVALVGIELQVRRVEEPYLIRTHGAEYAQYGRRTGRLLPVVGKLRMLPSSQTAQDASAAAHTP
jgi:protein-S-isoprenylcysteine O-methyltransferase Ste14